MVVTLNPRYRGADGRLTVAWTFKYRLCACLGRGLPQSLIAIWSVGRVLLRTTEAHFAGQKPTKLLTVVVGDGDDDVERNSDVPGPPAPPRQRFLALSFFFCAIWIYNRKKKSAVVVFSCQLLVIGW
jgi:hypothetical protein